MSSNQKWAIYLFCFRIRAKMRGKWKIERFWGREGGGEVAGKKRKNEISRQHNVGSIGMAILKVFLRFASNSSFHWILNVMKLICCKTNEKTWHARKYWRKSSNLGVGTGGAEFLWSSKIIFAGRKKLIILGSQTDSPRILNAITNATANEQVCK